MEIEKNLGEFTRGKKRHGADPTVRSFVRSSFTIACAQLRAMALVRAGREGGEGQRAGFSH